MMAINPCLSYCVQCSYAVGMPRRCASEHMHAGAHDCGGHDAR